MYVTNLHREVALTLSRRFSFFFSTVRVESGQGRPLGHIRRRFGLLWRVYDLEDERGRVVARIKSPIWRLWTFPVLDAHGQTMGQISKKWAGFAQEYFTDADNFQIDFGKHAWTAQERALVLASAVLIDFDWFENNQGSKR